MPVPSRSPTLCNRSVVGISSLSLPLSTAALHEHLAKKLPTPNPLLSARIHAQQSLPSAAIRLPKHTPPAPLIKEMRHQRRDMRAKVLFRKHQKPVQRDGRSHASLIGPRRWSPASAIANKTHIPNPSSPFWSVGTAPNDAQSSAVLRVEEEEIQQGQKSESWS